MVSVPGWNAPTAVVSAVPALSWGDGLWLAPAAVAVGVAVGLALSCRRRLARARAERDRAEGRVHVLAQDLERSKRRVRSLALMAKSAKAIRNEFLSSISHEVRTPMNTILGMTDLVLSTDLDAKQRRYLERVREAGDALLGLLNDLLDLSKIHAHRLRLDVQDFRLRDCIADVVGRYRVRAEQKGLALGCRVEPDVPDAVVGDPGRLRQVLGVLLSNALKFTEEGRIDVRVGAADAEDGEVAVHFAVVDTGVGVPAELQSEVFEAFRQGDGSVTREHGGCGIGLSIASELVAMMGGELGLRSRPGQGSTFRFTARFGWQGEKALSQVAGDLSRLSGVRVLVANGQEEMRAAVVGMLSALNTEAVATMGADAACAALRQARADGRPFRFAILDAGLPGGSAFDLARWLNRETDLGRPSVVFTTHAGRRGEVARCREAGVAAYLTFPLSVQELAQCLLMVLEARRKDTGGAELITTHRVRERAADRTGSGPGRGGGSRPRPEPVETGRSPEEGR